MWKWTLWIAIVGCVSSEHMPSPRCGNDILDADELCDGALIASNFRCGDGQAPTGCNACVPECATASLCGNGVRDDGEACDGDDVPACPAGTLGAVTCSATCEADTSACVPTGEVIVRVLQGTAPRPNVYVVSHRPDGTPLTECTTNAMGLCTFSDVPANGMITIGYNTPMGSLSTVLLQTYTHVTPPQTIEYVTPAAGSSGSGMQAYAYVPGAYSGATSSMTKNGCGEQQHDDFTTVHEQYFNPTCLDANQEGGVYAEARDASGAARAWSYLRRPVAGTTTFTLPAWSADFATLTAEMTNVPTATLLQMECTSVIDGLVPLTKQRDTATPTATETLTMMVPSGVATSARCFVQSSQDSAQRCEQRQTPPFTTFAFDGSDLLPPLTATFTVGLGNPINGWTCSFASQPTPTGDVSECFKGFSSTPTLIGWTLVAPGDFVGTLTAPRLGPSSPFPLTYVMDVPVTGHARRWAYSDVTGYSDYLDGRVEPMTGETCSVFHKP